MSRSVGTPVAYAIEENDIQRLTSRLTVYKSRIFFEAADLVDQAPNFAHPAAETGFFIPEALSWSGTKFMTVTVGPTGILYLMRHDSPTPIQPTIAAVGVTTDPNSRPGIYGNMVFYRLADGSAWHRMEIDEAAFIAGNAACVTSDAAFSDFTEAGAIYPVGSNDAFLCYILDGGIGVSLSIAGGARIDAPARFINPVTVYDSATLADVYLTHFAGAAQTASGRYFYFSDHDGSIKGIKYSNGMFSDINISIPSDLSTARVGNVFSHNDIVHMCYRFERREEFTSSAKYTNLSQSKDGFTFNLDQRVLVTMLDYRFLAAFNSTDQVIFSATNRLYQTDAHYQLIQEDAPSVETELVSVSGGPNSFSAQLQSGGEEYYDDTFIIDGAFSKLEVGVQSSDGDVGIAQTDGTTVYFKFMTYHDVVVADIDKDWGDGERSMGLQLVTDGMWHTSIMTHPMYMEIQGKQGVYDPAKELNNLYKFTGANGVKWSLSADLWVDDVPPGPHTHPGSTTTDLWSADLLTLLEDYPVFGAGATYQMNLYGWSRAGVPDTNPNTADTTPTNTLNDDFYGLVEVEDTNGNISTVVTTAGELASTYKNPIQTYFEAGARAGSDPVIYNLTNPGQGKKIKRIGIRVISGSGNTTYFTERVEMPGISALFTQESVADEQPFQVVDAASNWPLVDTLTLQITAGNDTNGNQVTMAYQPVAGKVYAIAIAGDVEFTRSGIRYLQDAHFVAQIPLAANPYAAPTWERSYPPGTGPTANSSVDIVFDEWPYYTGAILTKDDVVSGSVPAAGHLYLLHWADARFVNSEISSSYIPFFYSNGSKLKVGLYLAGSGAITDIVRGEFKIYVYESPETLSDFDYYGGESEVAEGTVQFSLPDVAANTWLGAIDHDLLRTSYSKSDSTLLQNRGIIIKNNTDLNAAYRIRMTLIANIETVPSVYDRYEGLYFGVYPADFAQQYTQAIPNMVTTTFDMTVNLTVKAHEVQELHQAAWGQAGAILHSTSRYWLIEAIGGAPPISNQVPSPGMFELSVPLVTGTVSLSGGLGAHIATNKKGVPQIVFSTRPYSAFNFEVTGRFRLVGPYSHAGLIGLAGDQSNFMLGYIRAGYAGIARVRDGIRVDIEETALAIVEENKLMDVRFWHRDGQFGVEVKRSQEFWPQRGSQFLYVWDGADGALATQDDIYHVGAYALIDPPKVRTTGFRSDSPVMGIMPLDWNPDTAATGISAFPSSGRIDIGGRLYNYSGMVTSITPRGPFQLRTGRSLWATQYNNDKNGYLYPNVESVEFTFFRWWTGAAHAADYNTAYVASSEGYAWLNDFTLWRVWITTSGQVVWLRNRSRWYSDTLPLYYSVDAEKIWIANVFTGMAAVSVEELSYRHPPGAFAFLDSDDSVSLHGFTGFSGDKDNSIMDLLETFCLIAGTEADPAGDIVIASQSFADQEEVSLD